MEISLADVIDKNYTLPVYHISGKTINMFSSSVDDVYDIIRILERNSFKDSLKVTTSVNGVGFVLYHSTIDFKIEYHKEIQDEINKSFKPKSVRTVTVVVDVLEEFGFGMPVEAEKDVIQFL